MFKKLKLKHYLLTVFSIIIVLSTILTFASVSGILMLRSTMDSFLNNTLNAETAVKNSRISVNVAARDLREMVLVEDQSSYDSLKENISKNLNTITEQVEVFKQAHGEEDGLAKTYEDAFNQWIEIANRAISELDQGDKEAAKTIIINECSPTLSNLVSIATQIDQVITEEKNENAAALQQEVVVVIVLAVGLFVIILIISLGFAFRATANITGATRKIMNAVTALSKGNLHNEIDYQAKNEFGELVSNMNFSFQELKKYVDAYSDEMFATLLLPAGITSRTSIAYKNEDEIMEKYLKEEAGTVDAIYVRYILPEKMKYNLDYLKKFSIFGDIKVMIDTVFAVIR